MPSNYFRNCKFTPTDNRGFSLVELMVVIVIVGILATGVVMSFLNPTAKVKAAAFEMRGDINLARSVAVRENEDVLVDFVKGSGTGYIICFDIVDPGGVDGCDDEAADEIIKDVSFEDVRYYDFDATLPTDGPTKTPLYSSELAGKALANENGIILAGNNITMQSNGTSDKDGAVIIYYPPEGTPLEIRGKPYSVVVNNPTTGKVQLFRWRKEMTDDGGTPHDDRWSRK
jgi:prepilin-type N-terminal cleavage/methylation domain-containing protein